MWIRYSLIFFLSCACFSGFASGQLTSYVATGNIKCYQCNIFVRGYQDVCGLSIRLLSNCTACMKTYARDYLHDAWLSYKYTSTETKYCVLNTAQYHRPEGCYTTVANQGYVTQCFCYSDYCNSSTTPSYMLWAWLIPLLILKWMFV